MNDLKIITQLQKQIGKNIHKVDKIGYDTIGYAINTEQQITGLCLSECGLKAIPPEISELVNLQSLRLRNNQISKIEGLEKMNKLRSLGLSGNQISKIEGLEKMNKLRSLGLSGNQISKIEGLERLTKLQTFWFHGNQISKIEGLKRLTNLHTLGLESNQISKIEGLERLNNLQWLWLSGNQISKIEGLEKLTNLQELVLSGNQISKIEGLENMNNLQLLWLESNQIRKIDKTILNISKNAIEDINLKGNPLVSPPLTVIEQGYDAVARYFEQIEKYGEGHIYEGKLMLVGEPDSGKTTLLNLLFDRTWKVPQEQPSTVGVDVRSGYKFPYTDNKKIEFNARIWDFGGQHIQYTLHQFFLTRDCLYVILVNDRKEHHHLEYWFNIINLLGTGSPVIVVLNERNKKKVSGFDEQLYRKNFPSINFTTHSVDFADLSDNRFDTIVNYIQGCLSGLPIVKEEVSTTWRTVSEKLQSLKEKKYISIDEYRKVCKDANVEREYQDDMLRHFHKLGIALYFEGDYGLKQRVFLDPNWVASSIYEILNDVDSQNANGTFSKQWLFNQWDNKELTVDEKEMLLQLMQQDSFDLCFPVRNNVKKIHEFSLFIAPILLLQNRPDTKWNYADNLSFRFQYPFMPAGILCRFIVRHHNIIKDNMVWSKGAVLKKDRMEALVTEEKSEKGSHVISIRIRGAKAERQQFLGIIRNSILEIHKQAFPSIKFWQEIPCICEECINSENPHYFAHTTIQTFIEKGRQTAVCEISAKDVPINNLVGVSLIEGEDFKTDDGGKIIFDFRPNINIDLGERFPKGIRKIEAALPPTLEPTPTFIERIIDRVWRAKKPYVRISTRIITVSEVLLLPSPWWQPIAYNKLNIPKEVQPPDYLLLGIGVFLIVIALIFYTVNARR